jgi:crotonobetainyl-CoA:carnitine CoA-transferase CaiB-like acyl-CoA transferase
VRGIYPCQGDDNWIAISLRNEDEWRAFCEATGNTSWLSDDRFATMEDRVAHHDELDALIEEWTRGQDKLQAMDLLQHNGVPAGAALTSRDIFQNEQLIARHFFDEVQMPEFGQILIQRYFPARIDGHGYPARGRAPSLGEHTDEVLRDVLGYDDAKLAALREAGVTTGDPQNWTAPEAREILIQPIHTFEEAGSILGVDDKFRDVIAESAAKLAQVES